VHTLQAAQSERRGQELEADRRVVELSADPLYAHAKNVGVVECEPQPTAVPVANLDRPARLALPWHVDAARCEPRGALPGVDEGIADRLIEAGFDSTEALIAAGVEGLAGIEGLDEEKARKILAFIQGEEI